MKNDEAESQRRHYFILLFSQTIHALASGLSTQASPETCRVRGEDRAPRGRGEVYIATAIPSS